MSGGATIGRGTAVGGMVDRVRPGGPGHRCACGSADVRETVHPMPGWRAARRLGAAL